MFDQETLEKLQFNKIKNQVKNHAIGELSKEKINRMPIDHQLVNIQIKQQETKEARLIIESGQHVPFMGLKQINRLMNNINKGGILKPSELIEFADFLRSNRMIRQFFKKNQYQTPLLYRYAESLADFSETEEHIYQRVNTHEVLDEGSRGLRKARRKLKELEDEIQNKLLNFLKNQSNRYLIQDTLIIKKDGVFTIPIKASYKFKIPGNIVENSNNGQTVYIEPSSISKLSEEALMQQSVVDAEEYQILAELTGELSEQVTKITNGIDTITMFDIIFARAKTSREYDGITPKMNQDEHIKLISGRHPFLGKNPVPLDFEIGKDYRGLIITGANAGGKTIVMKTVGLLTLMAMFGLQVPAQSGTELAVFENVFVDIGDHQDLENNLSTFSGHMKRISQILKQAGRNTLVLLDELGSGTEPNEGAGLAIAIIEMLYRNGALVVATTHYGEIKNFANQHQDFIPAAMQFDREKLTPQYILQIGQIGDSQALWIAKKMDMPQDLIEKADIYIKNKKYSRDRLNFKNDANNQTNYFKSEFKRYQKGDQVYLNETKNIGLVYDDDGSNTVKIFVDHQIVEVIRKRVNLRLSAQNLYPKDYDIDSLFVDFHKRKWDKDLERGSKKARKQLEKLARKRKL